jgi:hypothetical protein
LQEIFGVSPVDEFTERQAERRREDFQDRLMNSLEIKNKTERDKFQKIINSRVFIEPQNMLYDRYQIVDEKINPVKASGEIQTISIVNKNDVLVIGTKSLTSDETDSIKSDIDKELVCLNSIRIIYQKK